MTHRHHARRQRTGRGILRAGAFFCCTPIGDAPRIGDDIYALLMEGLESFMATAQGAQGGYELDQRRYARAADGRPYLTCSPHLAEPNRPTKDRWWEDGEPAEPRSILPLGHRLRGR